MSDLNGPLFLHYININLRKITTLAMHVCACLCGVSAIWGNCIMFHDSTLLINL
jgi:hypothetical protein